MGKKRVNLIITDECYQVLSEIAEEYGASLSSSINILAKLYKREQESLNAFKSLSSFEKYLGENSTEKQD